MKRAEQTSESIELGILLALSGGFMDAYSYIERGQVFANAQTGNILLFGVNLSEGNLTAAVKYLTPVIAFALGIALADLVRQRDAGMKWHWRQFSVLLEALILVAVSFIPLTHNLIANSLTSFACGIQVQSFRKIHGSGIATTMCIGNLRSGTQNLVAYTKTRDRNQLENAGLYFGVIFCFAVGAVFGNLFIGFFGIRAILVSALLLLTGFQIMFIDRERKKNELRK